MRDAGAAASAYGASVQLGPPAEPDQPIETAPKQRQEPEEQPDGVVR